jgi:hypothetical protein
MNADPWIRLTSFVKLKGKRVSLYIWLAPKGMKINVALKGSQ